MSLAVLLAAPPAVTRTADGGVTVRADGYTAAVDAAGSLTELVVGGVKSVAHRFGPGGGKGFEAPAVAVDGATVTARSGKATVAYTFLADRVRVTTEGYSFEAAVDPSVKAAFAPDFTGGPIGKDTAYPHTSVLVLGNDRALKYTAGFHVVPPRLVPSVYTDGRAKPGDRLTWEFVPGGPAGPELLLGGIRTAGVGDGYGPLAAGGNVGSGMVHFPDRNKIVLESRQPNAGSRPLAVEYRGVVLDHYAAGKPVADLTRAAEVPAGGSSAVRWELPPLPPGFYYLTVAARHAGQETTVGRLTFTVELQNYDRPDTTPVDFKAFWARQNDRLRATPPDPRLTRLSPPVAAHRYDAVTLVMPGGKQLRGLLFTPEKRATAPAVVSALIGTSYRELAEAVSKPDHRPATDRPTFWVVLPEDGTYTRWAAADDNNLLDCVLGYVRAVDYLTTVPGVNPKRVYTFGASRAGPTAFIAAALRPANVCGTEAHVHTSAGQSWTDKPYAGWGGPSGFDPANPEWVRRVAAMAAYVDPVNHAPFVTCPAIFGYGVDDHGLSPPQGIESMYRRAGSKWKRIARDAGGHVYSDGYKQLQKDLADHLGAGVVADPGRDRILTDH